MLRSIVATVGVLGMFWTSHAQSAPCAGFTDVDSASGFCVNVTWMKSRGITLGCTATLYCPNDPVTRLQMAAFMYRLGFENAFLKGGNAFGAVAKLGTTDNQPVEIVANGATVRRIEPKAISPNVVAGYSANALVASNAYGISIGGGGAPGNSYGGVSCPWFSCQNSATDHFGTIGGGAGNLVGDLDFDSTNSIFATVGGGFSNLAGPYGTVAGGGFNQATGLFSTAAGGSNNIASGIASFAAGNHSWATGPSAVAMGYFARGLQAGCIVLSDTSSTSATSCNFQNEFIVRALGGVYLFTGGTNDITYTGAFLGAGTSAWAAYSDRTGKDEIIAVDPEEVLRKVVAMPVSTWQWKTEPGAIRHMGPMAQDFHAAFGLGSSEKQIVTIDADGVALAAIQGLNAKLEATVATVAEQARENAQLRADLAELRLLKEEVASLRAAQSRGTFALR
jgi:hypothetical protein